MLTKDLQRIVVENTVRLQLRSYSPRDKRSLRRLVDTARRLTRSRIQSELLMDVSRLFEDESSLYYDAVDRLLTRVDRDNLIHFGLNLGYDAWSKGGSRIRLHEKNTGENASWLVEMRINEGNKDKYASDSFRKLLLYLNRMGVSAFSLFLSPEALEAVPAMTSAIRAMDEACFFLFLPDVLPENGVMEALSSLRNSMVLIPAEGQNKKAMENWLLEEKMLFGYAASPEEKIPSPGEYMDTFSQAESPVVFLMRKKGDLSPEESKGYSRELDAARKSPAAPLLLVDYQNDTDTINRFISGKPLSISLSDYLKRNTSVNVSPA